MTATTTATRSTIRRSSRTAGPVTVTKPAKPGKVYANHFEALAACLEGAEKARDLRAKHTAAIDAARQAVPDLAKKAGIGAESLRAYLAGKGNNTLRVALGWPKADKGPGCNAPVVQGAALHGLLKALAPICGLSTVAALADTNKAKKLGRMVKFAADALDAANPPTAQSPMSADEVAAATTAATKAACKVAAPEGARVLPWQTRAEVLGSAMAALCASAGAGVPVESVADAVLASFVEALGKHAGLTAGDAKTCQRIFSGMGAAIAESVNKTQPATI